MVRTNPTSNKPNKTGPSNEFPVLPLTTNLCRLITLPLSGNLRPVSISRSFFLPFSISPSNLWSLLCTETITPFLQSNRICLSPSRPSLFFVFNLIRIPPFLNQSNRTNPIRTKRASTSAGMHTAYGLLRFDFIWTSMHQQTCIHKRGFHCWDLQVG